MLIKIIIVVGVMLVALAAYVATRPPEFHITRSRTVAAPPEVVFAYVNDFHTWPEWSPWEKKDPAMKREHSGAPAGTGAMYAWSGNDQVGEGRMTITDSRPPHSVTIRLEFLKPWAATNTARFDFAPNGSGTNVTWSMTGRHDFMAKATFLFMNLDKLVGPDFENGLANLDAATTGKTVRTGS